QGKILDIYFEISYSFNTRDSTQSLIELIIKWTKIPDYLQINRFVNWIIKLHEIMFRDLIIEKKIPYSTEQTCAFCNTVFTNQPRSNFFITFCSKCRYPNIPQDAGKIKSII
ncbi:MAG: hypothetical protein ACFFD1_12580, partial [Candidatus Thorarchaeota archaeon]